MFNGEGPTAVYLIRMNREAREPRASESLSPNYASPGILRNRVSSCLTEHGTRQRVASESVSRLVTRREIKGPSRGRRAPFFRPRSRARLECRLFSERVVLRIKDEWYPAGSGTTAIGIAASSPCSNREGETAMLNAIQPAGVKWASRSRLRDWSGQSGRENAERWPMALGGNLAGDHSLPSVPPYPASAPCIAESAATFVRAILAAAPPTLGPIHPESDRLRWPYTLPIAGHTAYISNLNYGHLVNGRRSHSLSRRVQAL
ncbi:hypothetical protein FB451DRAFT_1190405 [Mycena latifolia]|nr:hypothetical protein FB451DRAFT_1190405 [Mycena latifolia]